MPRLRNKLHTVAAEAGCSLPTVSRALNGKPVSQKNLEKITQALHRLYSGAYVQYKVGLILPESANPYFSDLAFAFEAAFEKHDAQVLVTSAEGSLEREVKLAQRFIGLQVDGLIYVPTAQGSEPLLTLVAADGMPVVVFDRKVSDGNFDFVTVDSVAGTFQAIEYLASHGHKKIAYLKGLKSTFPAQERYTSFTEAMSRHALPLADELVFQGDFTLLSGVKTAERIMKLRPAARPTAILAANDVMAIGLLQRLQQAGWRVPEELSVIGFDNITWSQWTYPSLTTIAQPIEEMVDRASNALIDRIKASKSNRGRAVPTNSYAVETKLIVRASVNKQSRRYKATR